MFAIGNDQLDELKRLGTHVYCNACKKRHKIKYSDRVLADGTKEPSQLLAFVKCDNGKSYLVGVQGKFLKSKRFKAL